MSHERIEVFGDGGSTIAERLKSFRLTILGQSESLSIVRNPTDNSAWVTHDDTGLVLCPLHVDGSLAPDIAEATETVEKYISRVSPAGISARIKQARNHLDRIAAPVDSRSAAALLRRGGIPILSLRTTEYLKWYELLARLAKGQALSPSIWVDNYLAGDTPESAWANGRGLYELINNGNMTSANTIFPVWYSVALALGRFTTEELPVMNAWPSYCDGTRVESFIQLYRD